MRTLCEAKLLLLKKHIIAVMLPNRLHSTVDDLDVGPNDFRTHNNKFKSVCGVTPDHLIFIFGSHSTPFVSEDYWRIIHSNFRTLNEICFVRCLHRAYQYCFAAVAITVVVRMVFMDLVIVVFPLHNLGTATNIRLRLYTWTSFTCIC